MSFESDLAVLSADLIDDLDIGLDASGEYQDALPPAPVPAGNYVLRMTNLGASKTKAGEPVMQNKEGKKFPVLNYSAQVAEPSELEGRRAVAFQTIWTAPFDRAGSVASGLIDAIRAFDATRLPRTVGEQITTLKELAETGTFRVAVDWEAYDSEWFNEQKEARGIDQNDKPALNALRKEATVKGMKRFQRAADGSYLPIVKHPKSGNQLEAKAVVTRYIPSTQDGVRIG